MDKKCFWSMMALPSLFLAGSLIRPVETGAIDSELGDPDTWQAFFDREIPAQLEERQIVGAVVAVVEGEKLAFAKGYGFADMERREEVQADATLFRIGSITKLFTWTAVMQLAEQGKLDLDADVNGYLDFRIPDSFREPVTLRQLMTHTAGFEDSILGVQAISAQDSIADGEWLKSHIPARVSAPGEISSYSNYGAALAGYIVERVSGISYENYLENNILDPLGMNRTTVQQPVPADWASDLSKGFLYSETGFAEQDFEYFTLPSMGGATSTATDMARFMCAHLQNGR
jgi:CubicO group peptidase (beta-lactamase class C family)